jgi:hypothetical protein
MLKTKAALFRKAQGIDARSLYAAKSDRKMLCFRSIFKISRARPDVAVARHAANLR